MFRKYLVPVLGVVVVGLCAKMFFDGRKINRLTENNSELRASYGSVVRENDKLVKLQDLAAKNTLSEISRSYQLNREVRKDENNYNWLNSPIPDGVRDAVRNYLH